MILLTVQKIDLSSEPYEMKFSYTALRGGFPPISIKSMIGSKNVLRFRRLPTI
uniref:PetB n=1 Tax=Angelica tsinlingensis TaxID=357858 RepID=A0A2L1K1A9_9APIA|nr:PetB [Angelica tsinlingensis]